MRKINIAIDGPSGVGKSTIAKNISNKLNYIFINTGLMYRSIAYFCIKNKIDINDEINVNQILSKINLEMLINNEISLNDVNITKHLWKDIVSISASKIATYKKIREFCVLKQQKYTINKGIVMEGRDIGSVVIPNAELKIFLFASPEIRAERRIIQMEKNSIQYNEEHVIKNIKKRDKLDRNRQIDPLIKVKDAIEIDTSNISIQEVEDKIFELYLQKVKNE